MSEEVRETVTWILIAYTFVKDILPLIIPDAMKVWSKSKNREDRLFEIIEKSNERDQELAIALVQLTDAMTGFDKRLAKIESNCRN